MTFDRLLATALLVLAATGCATVEGPRDPKDPWESYNRSMYQFNDTLDRAVMKPVAKGYRAVTPNPVEKGVNNFFSNLGEIRTIANDLLQFKIVRFFSDTGRFLVNSTLGLGGLFDVATPMGLEAHDEDFGQTLGHWGVDSGPYLVLPFFGPSTLRDGPARIVDYPFDPIDELADPTARYSAWTLETIDTRAQLLEAGDIVQEAALDPYTFRREAYLQRRRNQVYDGNPPPEFGADDVDIFSED